VLDLLHSRAQRLRGVVGMNRNALRRDHRPRVDPLVDVVHGRRGLRHAGGEHVFDRMSAGKVRQQRGVRVDDPAAVVVEEGLAEKMHVAGANDEVDVARAEPLGERDVALLARLEVGCLEDSGLDPGALRALERAHAALVRRDARDR
jgi:hypothetical protein